MDSRSQEEVSEEEIGACLEITQVNPPDIQGDYTILNRCYRHASTRQTNPSRTDMEKLSGDYAVLYQQEYPSPPGIPVPTYVAPFQIDTGVPE